NVLKTWSHKLADGELDNRIVLKRKDEIGLLSEDFNKMADKLQYSIKKMEAEVCERKQAEKSLLIAQTSLSSVNETLEVRIAERTRELEEAVLVSEKANNAKSLFLANISHELRTPMHGILGFSKMGRDRVDSLSREKLKSYFDVISDSGDRLLFLLNDLLDLAKLESGKMTLHLQLADLCKIVESSIAEQESSRAEKKLTISINKDLASSFIMCDVAKIRQVIMNLLSNAIKYSHDGGSIKIDVSSVEISLESVDGVLLEEKEKQQEKQKAIKLTVSDEGIGIPENELGQVFDKFVQSSKTDSGSGGTGLGLAICMEIVALHQGRIWAENNAEGATFVVLLPLKRVKLEE
ncbi:MAG: ATP-binding protein, partial [Gammaproteobacteria bacterium]|nr:ATP-binding protein [Gammaproteobacteria bacterium]